MLKQCDKCDYSTKRGYDLKKHIKRKHTKIFKKCKCGREYKSRNGFYKHMRKYRKKMEIQENVKNINITNIIDKNITNITNNINNNISINLFLDKYCGNAGDLKDFVKNLKYTLEDVMNAYTRGYPTGITNVVLKGLENLPIIERPIHCSNKKTGQLFIKDDGKWEPDSIKTKGKVYKIMSSMRTKQYLALIEWENAHPTWERNEKESLERCKIINSLLGENDKMEKHTKKILKDVANKVNIKEVALEVGVDIDLIKSRDP